MSDDAKPIEYASHAPSEMRDSNLAIYSVIVPFVGPLIVAPIVGWLHGYLSLPRPIFLGTVILIMAAGIGLPLAAIVRIHLSRGTRTGIGWAACGLTVALLQVAIITFLILAG